MHNNFGHIILMPAYILCFGTTSSKDYLLLLIAAKNIYNSAFIIKKEKVMVNQTTKGA